MKVYGGRSAQQGTLKMYYNKEEEAFFGDFRVKYSTLFVRDKMLPYSTGG